VTGRDPEVVTRIVDADTIGMAVRELADAEGDSVTVIVRGKAGAIRGVLRTRTPAEQTAALHVPPRPAPRMGRRDTDRHLNDGVETFGVLSESTRKSTDHIGRGQGPDFLEPA
jgi:hypothetical protein